MKIINVVGTRPNFIKIAPIIREMKKHKDISFLLIHTGQHYDDEMSETFFKDLDIPKPDRYLGVGSASHAEQTGRIMIEIEKVLILEKPDLILVVGDVNSTIATALASVKLHIPIAHVEAGLRSFNRDMPEEINRILTDHISNLLFCPTETAVEHLKNEGITDGVYLVGDVMYDAAIQNMEIADNRSNILERLAINSKKYILFTIHRPVNTDNKENLSNIIEALIATNERIIFPVHPRTEGYLREYGLDNIIGMTENIVLTPPAGYLDMLILEKNAKAILTDSGGIQKEAYFYKVPCITLRNETEWIETVESGGNRLVGADKDKIINAISHISSNNPISYPLYYGDGYASKKIISIIKEALKR